MYKVLCYYDIVNVWINWMYQKTFCEEIIFLASFFLLVLTKDIANVSHQVLNSLTGMCKRIVISTINLQHKEGLARSRTYDYRSYQQWNRSWVHVCDESVIAIRKTRYWYRHYLNKTYCRYYFKHTIHGIMGTCRYK